MNANSSEIELIIIRSFFDKISEEEEKSLLDWINRSSHNKKVYKQLSETIRTRYEEPKYVNASGMRERILAEGYRMRSIPVRKVKLPAWRSVWRVAVVLVFGMSISYFWLARKEQPVLKPPEPVIVVKDNPPGIKSRIILSDSSIVWLNADSKLTYQKGFSDSIRFMELEGEAFFEVHKDANRPFVVRTGNISTRALGTSFNIRHFYNESETKVSLLTGLVGIEAETEDSLQTFLLKPYQQLNVAKNLSKITTTSLDGNSVSAWKDNILSFKGASFAFVKSSLERWYGVEIDASGYDAGQWQYRADFRNQSLEQVLSRMSYSQQFDFKVEKKKISIYNRK